MRLLYGSQNFGYDTADSDKDWMEFIYPTWKDIVIGNITSKEVHNEEGECIKIRDVRLIPRMLNKQNISDMQFLFSQQYIGEDVDNFKWFIENKRELIQSDMWNLYRHTKAIADTNLKMKTAKSVTRAHVYTTTLERILVERGIDSIRDIEFAKFRCYATKLELTGNLETEIKRVKALLESLEKSFKSYESSRNEKILNRVFEEVLKITRNSLA